MDSSRIPLSTGVELRFARWAGRVLTILALWPFWYAWFGKSQFDWGAMLFGGPGLLIGVLLWWWAGYRLRNPVHYLEIDREQGEARLARGGVIVAVTALEQLGAWSFRTWQVTSTHKGTRTTTTWNAARCEGLPGQDLFVDVDQRACSEWTTRVDAAARPSVLDPATLAAIHQRSSETSVGEQLAERVDELVRSLAGAPAVIALTLATGLCAAVAYPQLAQTDSRGVAAALTYAILFGVLALAWRIVRGPVIAAVLAVLAGLAYVAKPFVAPIVDESMGEAHVFSPTSETHLYFVIPGLALGLLAIVFVMTTKVHKPVAIAPVRVEPTKLDPPRPDPPRPSP